METRANFVLIGVFTLAVVVSAFGFVFWFQNKGASGSRVPVRIVFEGPASGLRTGASVNFNGIRVGEVQSVKIDNPQRVVAMLSVERAAPVRQDTVVGLEFQGLTGIAAVSLKGGSVEAPPVPVGADGIATLTADPNSIQDITEAARAVLQNVNRVVTDNQESIRNAVKSLESLAQTLERNGERVDNVMAGADFLVNKEGTGQLQEAAKSFRELTDNLDKRTAEISAGITKFTASGTKDISALIFDGRKTLSDISRAFTNLDKNPSRILFGGAGAEPEPKPRR